MSITGPLPDSFLNCLPEATRKKMGKRGQTIAEAIEKAEIKGEKDLHEQVVAYLEQHLGVKVGHARMDRKCTFTIGWPDLTFAFNNRPCAVELKVGTNKPDPDQRACMSGMMVNGWHICIAYNLEQVKVFLREVQGHE